jgi:hypothetical protein
LLFKLIKNLPNKNKNKTKLKMKKFSALLILSALSATQGLKMSDKVESHNKDKLMNKLQVKA